MWKRTLVLTATLLCLFSPLCYALSDVVVLDDTNFDIKTKSGDWFLEFYAPWCGHCKNLAATWEELGTSLKSKNINVGKIDCTENKVIAKRFGITGYPTIKFLKDSQIRDYSGSRRLNDFLTFSEEGYKSVTASPLPERLRDEIRPKVKTESAPEVPERTGPSDVVVLTASNFTSTISSGVWLVEFYAPWCGYCKKLAPIWEDTATKLKSSKVGVAKINVNDPENKALGRAFDIKGYPTIKYVKDGTYRDFAGERTVEGFATFVESGYKKLPSKPLPTPSYFEELLNSYLGWVEPIAEPYAEILMDNVAVVIVLMTFFGALVGFFIGRLSAPTSYVIKQVGASSPASAPKKAAPAAVHPKKTN